MLSFCENKFLGKKWGEIELEVAGLGSPITVKTICPPGKETQIGELRIIRVKKENEKLNFILTRDKF